MMEMQINGDFNLAPIVWNAAEVKAYVSERMTTYRNAVVSIEAVSEAKSDLANLRKLSKAINDQKISVKKQYMTPYTAFETEVKDVLAIIDEGIANISTQVAAFDEEKKAEKRAEIERFFALVIGDCPIKLEQIWDARWLNSGYKMADIQAEISKRLNSYNDHAAIIRDMKSPFETELLLELSRSLSLETVMLHKTALEAAQRAREARAATIQAEAEKPVQAIVESEKPICEIDTTMQKERVELWLLVDRAEKHLFRAFLKSNGIQYGAI